MYSQIKGDFYETLTSKPQTVLKGTPYQYTHSLLLIMLLFQPNFTDYIWRECKRKINSPCCVVLNAMFMNFLPVIYSVENERSTATSGSSCVVTGLPKKSNALLKSSLNTIALCWKVYIYIYLYIFVLHTRVLYKTP